MDTLTKCFAEVLEVTPEQVPELSYENSESWDSITHMALVAQIEETFNIMLDTDDIIDMSSYAAAKKILKKYEK